MTTSGLIERTDALFPNVYHFTQKSGWLLGLDKRLWEELLSRYEGIPEPLWDNSSSDRELLLGEEYSELYICYLSMLMELYSGNITGYQNKAALFNSHYLSFMNSFNRSHLMKRVNINIE